MRQPFFMTKKILFFIFFQISSFFVYAQSYNIEFGGKIGLLSPHRPVMKHLPQENIIGVDFSYFKEVTGKKSWHSIYNSPKIGLGFYYSNLGNSQILGNAIGIHSAIFFPFIKNQKHQFGLNLKLGVARISKPFDLIINPENIALSSYINCLAIAGLQYNYTFDKLSIGAKLELTHLSNAALKAPNLGVNMYQTSIVLGYNFSKNKMKLELINSEKSFENTKNKNYLYFLGFIGQKQLSNHLGINYKVSGGTLAYQHIFSLPIGFEIGLDLMKNNSDVQLILDKGYMVENVYKSGAYVGYVLTLEKLQFLVLMGTYIHDQFNLNDKIYHRVGMRYTLLNRFVLNCTLKSHWGNADYLELGLGLRFGK